MASKKITEQILFRRLKKYVCNNEPFPDLTKLSADERLELKIRYIDFMLADFYRISYTNGYLYDFDGISDDCHFIRYDFEDELSESQKALLQLCREIVKIVLNIQDEFEPDMIDRLGVRYKELSAYDRTLSKFLTETPYKYVAGCVLTCLTRHFLYEAARMGYQPAQDYLADLQYDCPLVEYDDYDRNKDCNDDKDIKKRLKALRQYEWHLKSGQKQGFTIEEIITHDEIYGFFMNRFEPTVMTSARRIARFIGEEMPKHVKGYVVDADLYYQPKEVKREIADGVKRVAEFVRKERDKYFAEGWLEDDSIAFSYLMAHAERIAVESAEKRR